MPASEVLKKIVVNHFFVVVNGPNTWEKDHDVFKHYEMPKEIARVRNKRTTQREHEDGYGLHRKDDARMAICGRLHFCAIKCQVRLISII